jgi:hypothetical protein
MSADLEISDGGFPLLPPIGTRVQWEASVNGSRFVGRVRAHLRYCGRPALDIEREPGGGTSIVYPEQLIRQRAYRGPVPDKDAPKERFTATIVCPDCGTEHVAPPSQLPESCECGKRFRTRPRNP